MNVRDNNLCTKINKELMKLNRIERQRYNRGRPHPLTTSLKTKHMTIGGGGGGGTQPSRLSLSF